MRGKILTVLVTLCCLTISEAVGRCRFTPFVLTGQVTEHGTGRGMAEAKSLCFWIAPNVERPIGLVQATIPIGF